MEGKYFLAGLVIAVLIAGGYLFYNSGAEISSQGMASLKVSPDTLGVYMNVLGKGKDLQDAKAEHDKIIGKLKLAIINSGFKESEIQTLNYNVYQDYDYSLGRAISKGYVVSEQVIVKTKDFDKTGIIIDKAIEADALVQSINFELSQEKQNEVKAEALKEAGKDAERKAKAIAEGVGKRIGRLISVSSQDFYYPGPVPYYEKVAGGLVDSVSDNSEAVRAAKSITPGEIEINAQISAKYKIR